MTKPLSMDIGDRAMARLDAGETVRRAAEALSVAPSSVVKWSQRRRVRPASTCAAATQSCGASSRCRPSPNRPPRAERASLNTGPASRCGQAGVPRGESEWIFSSGGRW
jgi:hypothetical protein